MLDAGEADGILYIASRLVDGVDLGLELERCRTLSVERALAIAAQLAGALDFAHSRDIVHRDVKPANVLLVAGDHDDAEHAYLIDFGITTTGSRDMRLTATDNFVGTPEYVSPEQLSKAAVDGRADQYALACLLYRCLVGASPFQRSTSVDVLHAHLHAAPPRPSDGRPDLPRAVDEAILRALSKRPEDRYESCRAFVAAARSDTDDGGGAAGTVIRSRRRVVEPESAPEPRRRRGALVAVAALLAALGVAAALAVTLLGGGDTPRASGGATPATPPTTTTPPSTASQPTATTPGLDDLDVAALRTERVRLKGYSVELPVGWRREPRDGKQPSPPGVTRSRTVATDSGRGLSLLIDALTGFDVPPAENRAMLEERYSHDPDKPGYRLEGLVEPDLDGTRGYELRYRFDSPSGEELRHVDVIFARGPPLAPVHGTYSGKGRQYARSGAIINTDRVRITFAPGGTTIVYPGLGCRGRLYRQRVQGRRRIYLEEIQRGKTCPNGGRWEIERLTKDKIAATWTHRNDPRPLIATLTR